MKHRVIAVAVASLFAASAEAMSFDNATGLASPDRTITFDGVALTPNQPVTTQFAAGGVTFANAYGNPDSNAYPNLSGNRIGNFQSGSAQNGLFSATFASPLSGIGFALVTAPGLSTMQALLGGALVESATFATSTSNPINYYGFTGIVFDTLTISVVSMDHAFLLDNLQTTVAAVPEPGSWALFLAGSVAVTGLTRRRGRSRGPRLSPGR